MIVEVFCVVGLMFVLVVVLADDDVGVDVEVLEAFVGEAVATDSVVSIAVVEEIGKSGVTSDSPAVDSIQLT